ncbi:MAG: Uncharacterised protein [Flavobacteriaceae bacterium]|nr:MAG: Uncharacterised protein [Flavobacteriaceae bacterium]
MDTTILGILLVLGSLTQQQTFTSLTATGNYSSKLAHSRQDGMGRITAMHYHLVTTGLE